MRKQILTPVILAWLFIHCTPAKKFSGKYNYNNTRMDLHLKESAYEYQYFISGEWGLRSYSAGSWKAKGNRLFLSGFNDDNLKEIHVESKASPARNSKNTQIIIQYATDKFPAMHISQALINDRLAYNIESDTILNLPYKVNTIQLKSYLAPRDGVSPYPPLVDTLYSQKINVAGDKDITLRFAVFKHDFYREKSSDTLHMTRKYLLLGKKKLK